MTFPTNFLQTVATYQEGQLALLQNLNCFLATSNKRFKDFNNLTANLGSSVTYDLPPRFLDSNGLVVSFGPATQRVATLTCDQAKNVGFPVTAQQLIFNLENAGADYLPVFARCQVAQLGAAIEGNIAKNADSSVPVMTIDSNGQSVPTGALHTESGPCRFFGDGTTPINSYQQLAQMVENYVEWGTANRLRVYLPNVIVPPIIGSGLNQFVPDRNNKIAMSWDIGKFGAPPVEYYKSNLLPRHVSGNVGNNATVLTVVSTNDPTGQNITQITFSGATASDANAIFSGDLGQFKDGVSGQPDLRLLTFIGGFPTNQPVQFRSVSNVGATGGGQVTVTLAVGLTVGMPTTSNWGINTNIVAGMQVTFLPTHRCGLVVSDDALFLAMPRLPDTSPFPSSTKADEATGAALRGYYGFLFGQNQYGYIVDSTWGSNLPPEYCMRVIFPD